jgi:hypothetical protein
MAITGSVLGALIKSKMLSKPSLGEVLRNDIVLDQFVEAIGEAIDEHLTSAAVVTVNVVTSCPAGAGTGTGTGSIA